MKTTVVEVPLTVKYILVADTYFATIRTGVTNNNGVNYVIDLWQPPLTYIIPTPVVHRHIIAEEQTRTPKTLHVTTKKTLPDLPEDTLPEEGTLTIACQKG